MIHLLYAVWAAPALGATFGPFTCVEQAQNVLRYTCTASTSADQARVVFWERGSAETRATEWSPVGESHTFTLWGLRPETTYEYRIEALGPPGTSSSTRSFTTDALDVEFGAPFAEFGARTSTRPGGPEPFTQYVLVNAGCDTDRQYLVILDREGYVVWYQAPTRVGDLSAITFTPDHTVLAVVDDVALEEWSLDGTLVRAREYNVDGSCMRGAGPCPHHDALRVGDETWVLTGQVEDYPAVGLSGCATKTGYVIDGVHRLDADLQTIDQLRLDTDLGLGPDVTMGPRFNPAEPTPRCEGSTWSGVLGWYDASRGDTVAPIDYAHANALDVSGDFLYVSLWQFYTIIKVDLTTRRLVWQLHGTLDAFSDFAVPMSVAPTVVESATSTINGTHHVSIMPDGRLQAFNNQADIGIPRTRVVRIRLDEVAMTATLEEAFTMVDDDAGTYATPAALGCSQLGSAFTVGDGSRVVASCGSSGAIAELDQPDGTTSAGPVWYMELTCGADTLRPPNLYRAVPIESLD